MSDPTDAYWPTLTGLDLASAAFDRVRKFKSALPQTTMYRRWERARRVFHGFSGQEDPFDISKAGVTGDQGELTSVKVNHAGSIARRAIALVAQTTPEFDVIAENDDADSLEQCLLGERLLDYYMDTKRVGELLLDCANGAMVSGENRLEVAWDPMAGSDLPPATDQNGQPLMVSGPPGPDGLPTVVPAPPDPQNPARTKTGDLVFRVYSPKNLIIDLHRQNPNHDWMITQRPANKWDIAARYPTLKDEITSLRPSDSDSVSLVPTNSVDQERQRTGLGPETDEIALYTLYHRKSDALPNGRWCEFLSADLILAEGDLPYDEIPLVPVVGGKVQDTVYAESLFHHILALQEVYDVLASSVATNNIQTATQIFLIPEGCEYAVDELSQGATVIRYRPGPDGKAKPEAISLTASNVEAMKTLDAFRTDMELVFGINATLRGAPQPNVTSGAFAALLHQEALEYHGPFQYSFQQAVAKTGDLIIAILKRYADAPIVAEIAGEANSYQVESFTRDKLSNIRRVVAKSGNPASRTPTFNMAMADTLISKGLIKTPQDYLTLARTGQMDTVIGSDQANLLRIRRENQMLRKGQIPRAIATDSHRLDIERHSKDVLDSPAVRDNQAVVNATLAHIQQHIELLQTTNPALLNLIGETPLPPPGMPPVLPGAPGLPPGDPAAAAAPAGLPPGPDPHPPSNGPLPHQPNLPKNPLTGARWTPADGARGVQ